MNSFNSFNNINSKNHLIKPYLKRNKLKSKLCLKKNFSPFTYTTSSINTNGIKNKRTLSLFIENVPFIINYL